jgi:hypothetical protein
MPSRAIYDFDRGMVTMDDAEYLLALQRAVCDLISLAKENGLNDVVVVNQAKELIRCRVLRCGLAGACNGIGGVNYPCPLKRGEHAANR